MTLGKAQRQLDILDENRRFCEKLVGEKSVYALLHRSGTSSSPTRCSQTCSPSEGADRSPRAWWPW